jgi:hypothetical protein
MWSYSLSFRVCAVVTVAQGVTMRFSMPRRHENATVHDAQQPDSRMAFMPKPGQRRKSSGEHFGSYVISFVGVFDASPHVTRHIRQIELLQLVRIDAVFACGCNARTVLN